MTTPTLQDEVSFIASVNGGGKLAQTSFYGWNQNNPATYNSHWVTARKWGGTTAGTSGGTVSYYFDPKANWSATEKSWFSAGLALWSAIANIHFVQTTNGSTAGITFHRTNDSSSYTYAIYNPTYNADVTGGSTLGTITSASINIDTTGTSFGPISGLASQGGFTIDNLLHEEGHALGLGHAGPYDGGAAGSQQFSPYDTRRWSIMSYFDPGNTNTKYGSQYPVKGGFGGGNPTTPQMLDIQAIQRLYGTPSTTPLAGGQTFGFHTNISGAIRPFFDFTQNTKPVITIWDKGTNNSLDLSGFTTWSRVNLNPGTFTSTSGMNNNIGIAFGTRINRLVCSSGGSNVTCNNFGDTVIGGAGNDTINGGAGNDTINGGGGTNTINGGGGTDTAVFSGYASSYKIVHNSNGTVTVTGNGVKDTLSSIEVLKFGDKSITLSGSTVLASGTLQNTSSPAIATAPASSGIGWTGTSSPTTSFPTDGMVANVPLASSDPLTFSDAPLTSPAVSPTLMPAGALQLARAHTSWHIATM